LNFTRAFDMINGMEQLKKNQIHTVEIDAWNSDGAGVARIGGRAVFVPGAIPGETWEIRILKATATAVYARGERCLAADEARTAPECPVYEKCGGCALRHVSYEAELACKLQRVNDAYSRIGGLPLRAETILGAENVDHYRNKAIYAVSSVPEAGFFRKRTHQVIPVSRCALQAEASDRAAAAVCEFCRENGIPAYDEQSGRGVLRHVFTRTARSGAMQVTVVAARGFGAATGALVAHVLRACPETVGLILNINKTRGNTVLAGDFHTLWGSDTLEDVLCGHRFELSPMSFYQVNPAQAERLYAKALEYAAPEGKGTVLDLYCGAGTISLCLAAGAERVIGAEIVPEAVENARANAKRNGVHNVEFICADAGQAAQTLLQRGARPDAVVVDPPRKGLSPEVIEAVCTMQPERVVYVSCDVATQARDLKLFAARGYAAVAATAVDMFPRTMHVETVVLLGRKKVKEYFEYEYEPVNDDYLKGCVHKATYGDIAEWVQKEYGLHVSNLYIAQVKRECGLDMGENYNKGAEGHRVPKCPPEKREAILAALRYFGVIE